MIICNYRRRHPHNLLAMLDTWLNCDLSANPIYGGDYVKALGSISARTLVMPATTDLYFTPADCLAEAQLIPKAIYQPSLLFGDMGQGMPMNILLMLTSFLPMSTVYYALPNCP